MILWNWRGWLFKAGSEKSNIGLGDENNTKGDYPGHPSCYSCNFRMVIRCFAYKHLI